MDSLWKNTMKQINPAFDWPNPYLSSLLPIELSKISAEVMWSLSLSEASAENSYDIYHRSVKNTNIGRNPAFVLFNRIISSKKTTLNKHISLDNKMLGNQFFLSSYVNEKPRNAYFSSVSESEGKTSWLQWHPPYYVKQKINFIKNTVGPKIRLDCPLQNYLNLTIKCRNVESLDCSLLPYLI